VSAAAERTSLGSVSYSFAIVGVPVVVIADPLILEIVDDTYGAYRTAACESSPYLLEVEERFGLLGITNRRHHDLVEDLRGALDDLEVSVMKGVEGARDETNRHSLSPLLGSNIVTSVVP